MKRYYLLALILGCNTSPSPASTPPEDPIYVAETDRFAVRLDMSGSDLRAIYKRLSPRCNASEWRVFRAHRRLANTTYDAKGSLESLPTLCEATNWR